MHRRDRPSAALQTILNLNLIEKSGIINGIADHFDYGCGLGFDIKYLRTVGICSTGWDKYQPKWCDRPKIPAHCVTLSFVLECIADPQERAIALIEAWNLTQQHLIITCRDNQRINRKWIPHKDGWLSTWGTFQTRWKRKDMIQWCEAILEQPSATISTHPPAIQFTRGDRPRQGNTQPWENQTQQR